MKISSISKSLPLILLLFAVASPLSAAPPQGWTSDYQKASLEAERENRKLLLLFTGSDWCIWCKRLTQEILDTDTFKEWATENIVLVYVDFPQNDYRTEAVRSQNAELDKKYDVKGYPTAIITDTKGKELTRLGYMQGGPKTFIRAIQKAGH